MPPFDKVSPGAPLQFSATVFNEMLDMLSWYKRQTGGNRSAGEAAQPRQSDTFMVSFPFIAGAVPYDGDLSAFSVVSLDKLSYELDDEDGFLGGISFSTVVPTANHWGNFGVILEAMPKDAQFLVPCLFKGLVPVQIDVPETGTGEYEHWADTKADDPTQLQAGFFGRARILWREGGTGTQWSVVDLGQEFRGPVLAKPIAPIDANSSGDVEIYFHAAGLEQNTEKVVRAHNLGPWLSETSWVHLYAAQWVTGPIGQNKVDYYIEQLSSATIIGKTATIVNTATKGTVNVWRGDLGSEVDTGETILLVRNRTSVDIAADKWVVVNYTDGEPYMEPWEC